MWWVSGLSIVTCLLVVWLRRGGQHYVHMTSRAPLGRHATGLRSLRNVVDRTRTTSNFSLSYILIDSLNSLGTNTRVVYQHPGAEAIDLP
jgi:hypothetical protein